MAEFLKTSLKCGDMIPHPTNTNAHDVDHYIDFLSSVLSFVVRLSAGYNRLIIELGISKENMNEVTP